MRIQIVLFCAFVFLFSSCTKIGKKQEWPIISEWKFWQVDSGDWMPAKVPGNVHSDLLRAGRIPDPYYRDNELKIQWVEKKDWEYITIFDVDKNVLVQNHQELVFDGIDTYATIVLNGDTIAQTDNMFIRYRLNVTGILKEHGNKLSVYFESAVEKMIPFRDALPQRLPSVNDKQGTCQLTRKAPYHYGWDWGPRMVTCGIWKPFRIETWDHARIDNIQMLPISVAKDKAIYQVNFEITSDANFRSLAYVSASKDVQLEINMSRIRVKKGTHVYSVPLEIKNPDRWFPVGYGNQPLYKITAQLRKGKDVVDEERFSFAIRKVELNQEKDAIGKSFYFKLNDIPVFCKGANMIPLDNMLDRATPAMYRSLLNNAVSANMNMIRTWGGGIYENDIFYKLCDSLGIMVWQDFMFGNEMYKVDSSFLNNVTKEVVYNIKRLRNYSSIVLWCGDNEGEWMWKRGWNTKNPPSVWTDYKKITWDMIPNMLKIYDPSRSYWRSSPTSESDEIAPNDPSRGDMHDWSVHFGAPPYEKYLLSKPRFVSEFGHQSFPDWKTMLYFTSEEDRSSDYDPANFGQKMRSEVLSIHNKQGWGNQKIREYMEYYYGFTKKFRYYVYLSQITHAEAVRCGVEHYRRLMPHCMGSLYWQLNDCWPVTSWSSIDYFGRWKALHFFARNFYAPILVSPVLEEDTIKVFVISDLQVPIDAELSIKVLDMKGNEKRGIMFMTSIDPLTSKVYYSIRLDSLLRNNKSDECYIDCSLIRNDKIEAQNILYFKKPIDLKLPKNKLNINVKKSKNGFELDISTYFLSKNIYLYADNVEGNFTDNYFDLLPGKNKTVYLTTNSNLSADEFKKQLDYITLNQILK